MQVRWVLLGNYERTHMNSYIWTPQVWSTSKELYTSALCWGSLEEQRRFLVWFYDIFMGLFNVKSFLYIPIFYVLVIMWVKILDKAICTSLSVNIRVRDSNYTGHLPPITKTIQVRRTRHAGHCWRSKDELISDVLLWTPTYGCARVGRPARTYIQQLCEDTGCNPEDLPEAMNDREKWRERVRDIRAGGATWWWW